MKNDRKYVIKTLVDNVLDFDYIGEFEDGLAPVFNEIGVGFIEKTGKVVIPIGSYDNVNRCSMLDITYGFNEGLSPVTKDNKCGFINTFGEVVIPLEYEAVLRFIEGIAAVRKEGKWGFINKLGETVIPFKYDFAQNFSEGLALVNKNKKHFFINKDAVEVISFNGEYTPIQQFKEGVALVSTGRGEMPNFSQLENESKEDFFKRLHVAFEEATKNERFGFINKCGEVILPLEYSYLSPLCEGIALSVKNGVKRYINQNGTTISLPFYNQFVGFHNGIASVKKDNKMGCIDKTGKLVVPFKYDNEYFISFNEGLAAVKLDDKWGYIDMNGEIVIPIEYEQAERVNEGIAVVRKDGKWGLLEIELEKSKFDE